MNDSLCGLTEVEFEQLAAEYAARWQLPLLACRVDGRVEFGVCPRGEDGPEGCAARELALREALRWGEPTFSLTNSDLLLWAVPLMVNARLCGGLTAHISARLAPGINLNRAAADLRRLVEQANLTNAALLEQHRLAEGRERTRAEAIHSLKAVPQYNLRQMYLLEEPALAAAVRRGERGEAREVLNRLLVGIHACAGDRLDLVKSFYAELVVTLSRTAVWAGGAPEAVLQANLTGLARLAAIDDPTALALWLREMLEQAMDAVNLAHRREDGAHLATAIGYLHEHFAEDLSRDEVARIGLLSPAHFSRQLHKHYGLTFTQLLTKLRVDYAAELLRRTDKAVGLVALECGFADQSYFTKVFARAKGLTPLRYRASG